jgi:hypothetical protein
VNLKSHFPKASKSFLNANPHLCGKIGQVEAENALQPIVARRRGKMNKVEIEFSFILEAHLRAGEILRYDFEGITLRWPCGDKMLTYTADFAVFHRAYIKLVECKGPFVGGNRERAVERFRHAKTYFGDARSRCASKRRATSQRLILLQIEMERVSKRVCVEQHKRWLPRVISLALEMFAHFLT